MYAARVVGHTVSTKKDQRLVGWKLLIVSPLSLDGASSRRMEAAVDIVGVRYRGDRAGGGGQLSPSGYQ